MGIVPRATFANDQLNRYSQGYDLPSAPRSAGMVCGRGCAGVSDSRAPRRSRLITPAKPSPGSIAVVCAWCVPEKGERARGHATWDIAQGQGQGQ